MPDLSDPGLAGEALVTLAPFLGPPQMPADEGWWQSPLGLLAAAASDDDEDGWVTQRQAADALDVSQATVWRMIDRGDLAAREGGPTGGRLVSRRDVSALVLARDG